MSMMDDIRRLHAIASSERIPIQTIQGMQGDVLLVNSEVKAILGEGHGFYHGIGATGAAYSEKLGEALAAAEEWASAIHDAADKLAEDSGG
jgi:hypothetical protein